jgi:heptosyltransferase-2
MTARLVVAPNWIGDAVLSLPFLRALRAAHPPDRLAVLARKGPATIYRSESTVDEVLERSPRLRDDARTVRSGRFDEAWLLPNSFRAALIAYLGGARRRIGYATDHRTWLLTHALPPPSGTEHQLRDYDALLRSRGIEPDLGAPWLPIPPEALARADRALAGADWSTGARPILLAPGSAKASTKRWPPERFAALGDALALQGWPCGLVVGPDEVDLGGRVSAAARTPLPVLGADLDPIELAALLSRARLLVSNDSGPMHLAAAVGTPVVAFFGPTDPGRTAGVGSPVKVLDRYLFCSPCHRDSCPYGHECMGEITVEMAARACEELVNGGVIPRSDETADHRPGHRRQTPVL